jgi:hypothetical protein
MLPLAGLSRRALVAIAAPAGTGESLDAQIESRFATLDANFAVFAGQAANGFG